MNPGLDHSREPITISETFDVPVGTENPTLNLAARSLIDTVINQELRLDSQPSVLRMPDGGTDELTTGLRANILEANIPQSLAEDLQNLSLGYAKIMSEVEPGSLDETTTDVDLIELGLGGMYVAFHTLEDEISLVANPDQLRRTFLKSTVESRRVTLYKHGQKFEAAVESMTRPIDIGVVKQIATLEEPQLDHAQGLARRQDFDKETGDELQNTLNTLPFERDSTLIKLVCALNVAYTSRLISDERHVTFGLLTFLQNGDKNKFLDTVDTYLAYRRGGMPIWRRVAGRTKLDRSYRVPFEEAFDAYWYASKAEDELDEIIATTAQLNVTREELIQQAKTQTAQLFVNEGDKIDAVFREQLEHADEQDALQLLAVDTWRADVLSALIAGEIIQPDRFANASLRRAIERFRSRPLHQIFYDEERAELSRIKDEKCSELESILQTTEAPYAPTATALRHVEDGPVRRQGVVDNLRAQDVWINERDAAMLVILADRFNTIQDPQAQVLYMSTIASDSAKMRAALDEFVALRPRTGLDFSLPRLTRLIHELVDAGRLDFTNDKAIQDFCTSLTSVTNDYENFVGFDEDLQSQLKTFGSDNLKVFPPARSDQSATEIIRDFANSINQDTEDIDTENDIDEVVRQLQSKRSDVEWERIKELVNLRDNLKQRGKNAELRITAPTRWSEFPYFLLSYSDETGTKVVLESPLHERATYVISNEEDGIWQMIAEGPRNQAREFETVGTFAHVTEMPIHRTKLLNYLLDV